MNIVRELYKLQNLKYLEFSSKLIPSISKDKIIGVKTPLIRELSKRVTEEEMIIFLNDLPHQYQEENLLHAFLLGQFNDINLVFNYLDVFLPYVDNWAVCDVISLKIFKKYPKEVHQRINKWLKSENTYTKRFAIVSLLQFYLEDNFDNKDLIILSKIKSKDYYVNMALAWYYSFALIKQYDSTVALFENYVLDKWIHNKSIQKALESYRINESKKAYLKSLKLK